MDKKKLLILFAFVVIATSAIATYVYKSNKTDKKVAEIQPQALAVQDVAFTPVPDLENKDVFTVLLLGYGGAGHQGGFLSDLIQIAQFNFTKKNISLHFYTSRSVCFPARWDVWQSQHSIQFRK